MAKQIRFMGTTTNQSAAVGSDVQLNCYAQYYSEKVRHWDVSGHLGMNMFCRRWILHMYLESCGFLNGANWSSRVGLTLDRSILDMLLFLGEKYRFGIDSLVIQNFTYADQGVYYCRAFITLRTNFLTKVYPILVQLQSKRISP